ncbi:TRAP transporter small permease [Paenirhodobacter enshiensis]|uniref:TRAP transporter small permease n=1 Tax=Paenirhodobacter enshiensis TaxID=1105367 RepID=UPI0035B18BB0
MVLFKFCEKALAAFVALLMLTLVAMVFTNVVLRYCFHSSFAATEELSRVVLSVLILAGTVLAFWQTRHIAMTMLVEKLPRPVQTVLVIVVGGVMLWCDALLTEGAWKQAAMNLTSSYPLSGLPSATVYVIAAGAGALLFAITAARMILVLLGKIVPGDFFGAVAPEYAE